MPWSKERIPSYCKHKATGQAVVTLNGRDFYLGVYNSPASKAEYNRLVAEFLAGNRTLPSEAGISVNELLLAFLRHAEVYYRAPDGKPTSEYGNFCRAAKPLKALYGSLPAKDFSPLKLAAVRDRMVADGWVRTSVNREVGRLQRVFKWGASAELVPASVYESLRTVAGLRAGRSDAQESEPVRPVPQATLDVVLPYLSRHIRAIVELQLATGARPGEILCMKVSDLDMAGPVWKYRPAMHKTAHHGHQRTILIGPRGQAILKPFLRLDTGYVFRPVDAAAEHAAAKHAARKTALSCGNRPGTNRKKTPKRTPGECYDVASYRRAITRACQRAGVASFHPHMLRHAAATRIAAEFGLEQARTILGHATLSATLLYAETSIAKAAEVVAKIG